MENHIFLRPAVAGLLEKGFIESRHHVDVQFTLTPEQFAANRKLRDEVAGSSATPFYVIVDPDTGKKLDETGLSGGPDAWEANFIEFLNRASKGK